MLTKGEQGRLASRRAAGQRKAAMLKRLTRVDGEVYTVGQVALRLGISPQAASLRLALERKRGPLTWAGLARETAPSPEVSTARG